jgi:hypothetical protein
MQDQVAELQIVSLIGPIGQVFSKDGMNGRGMVPGRSEKTESEKAPAQMAAGALRSKS